MKSSIKKIIFPVFLIIFISLTMIVSSAADDYTMAITADSLGVSVDDSAQLTAKVLLLWESWALLAPSPIFTPWWSCGK